MCDFFLGHCIKSQCAAFIWTKSHWARRKQQGSNACEHQLCQDCTELACVYVCGGGGLELPYLWEERRESEDLRGPEKGLLVCLCISVARTEEGVIW